MNPYRMRILRHLKRAIEEMGVINRVLDFGCGDGWIASQIKLMPNVLELTPLDIKKRSHCYVEPEIYDPRQRMPYSNLHFTASYTVDVLHHCADPLAQVKELDRITERFIVLKDHTYSSFGGWAALALLDEVGNRRFGIPSPNHYQREWEWMDLLAALGWSRVSMIHPMDCHGGPLGALTNHLQFMAIYERR